MVINLALYIFLGSLPLLLKLNYRIKREGEKWDQEIKKKNNGCVYEEVNQLKKAGSEWKVSMLREEEKSHWLVDIEMFIYI